MRLSTEAVRYDLKMIRTKQVPILDCIDKVCREHGLQYYIWAGTLLGAVRHGGFIPWDDDMDIGMPRPDYEQLMVHCHEWMPHPYEVIGSHNRIDYPYPFAKVIDGSTTLLERPDFLFPEGLYIDIFPIDGFPSDRKKGERQMKHYRFYRHLLYLRGRAPFKHGKGPRSWWPLLIHKMFSLKWIQEKVQGIMKQYRFEDSERVIDFKLMEHGIVEKKWLGKGKEYEFEGKTYIGVENADACLTAFYGDYMTLPPKEKQVQHVYHYVNLDTPYRELDLQTIQNKQA